MNVGRTIVGLLVLVGLAGALITGEAFYVHLLYLGVLILVVAWIWVRTVARSLRLSRRPEFWRASVGDIFKEQYEISNPSRLPGSWVELYNAMPIPAAAGSRLLTRLNPGDTQTYIGRTWLTRRGGFPVGPTVLSISDPLGIFQIQRRYEAERALVVLPMIVPITAFLSPPGFLPGGQVIRRKAMEITPHAAGVRAYVPGDPLRRIHWPTTARRGELIVKEFEQDPQAEVWLFLDAQEGVQAERPHETPSMPLETLLFTRKPKLTLPPSTLEYEISIAASLAHYFIAQKRSVGLVTKDRAYAVIAAEPSQRQETKILETLAFIEGKGDLSIAAMASAHAPLLPKGSTVILLTPSTSSGILMVADDLLRRKLKPAVVLLDAASFNGPEGSDRIVQGLENQQIPIRFIKCGADLTTALSGFSVSESPDTITWQRPVLSHLT
jgi:uncharacterized protein (DUF58 family)